MNVTLRELPNEIEFYEDIVIKKPISEVMQSHLIQGFVVKLVSTDHYDLFVMGENLNHSNPILIKRLDEWLNDNGY